MLHRATQAVTRIAAATGARARARRFRRVAARAPRVLAGQAIGDEVVQRVRDRTFARAQHTPELEQMLYETIYHEEQRLADGGNLEQEARNRDDARFVRKLRHELAHADDATRQTLWSEVAGRYAAEIAGHFDPRVYRVTTGVLPPALGVLLHGAHPSRHIFDVTDRILLEGELDTLRAAARVGTIVLSPTHVSNLDALVLGYAIYALGLPPFAYGAGLNLFTHATTGFFMRNLGAFTVDRKKRDPLYREVVKEYATTLIAHGQHALFFPGGTRSRSGAIEGRLKLGFLGTAVTAFGRRRAQDAHAPPVFIVPCTISYPLVLEASSLIEQYLRREGGPHFIDVRDEFEQPQRWFDFLRQLSQLDVRVHVRFGAPLDFAGNPMDERGVSYDGRGRALDCARYLSQPGAPVTIVTDPARDAEYTRQLAGRLVASLHRQSVALPSGVLAFVVFERLRRALPQLDIFRLLHVLGPHTSLPVAQLRPDLEAALAALAQLERQGQIQLGAELRGQSVESVLDRGCDTLRRYHRTPVLLRDGGRVHVRDPRLLLYYRNRLDGYGLPSMLDRSDLRLRPSPSHRAKGNGADGPDEAEGAAS